RARHRGPADAEPREDPRDVDAEVLEDREPHEHEHDALHGPGAEGHHGHGGRAPPREQLGGREAAEEPDQPEDAPPDPAPGSTPPSSSRSHGQSAMSRTRVSTRARGSRSPSGPYPNSW